VIARRVGLPTVALPAVAVALLVTSPLFASTLGMETFLSIAVLVGVARYAVAGRTVATGLMCGLAVLARPDLAVPAAVLAIVLLVIGAERKIRTALTVAGVAAATALPWHLVSWVVLGGFIPDTYAIKSAAGSFAGGETFLTGPIGIANQWARATVLIAVPMAVALAGLVWWALRRAPRPPAARVAVAFAVAGIGHWAAFAAVGVPPYHWYYCPVVGLLCISGAVTVCALPWRPAVPVAALFVGLCAGYQLSGPVPWVAPVIYGNWGTADQYEAMARAIGDEVPKFGEVGALAYYCDCNVVGDPFADRAFAQQIIDERHLKAGPVGRLLLHLNYLFHHRPPAPTRADYQLVYTSGPGPGWRVDGPLRGQAHIQLVPGAR
jgi:hypothetical protein